MDKLYIIIPAYNEEENIRDVIDGWYPIVEKYNGNGTSRLVIIDDGSKDNTYEIMKKYAKTRPLFIPVTKFNGGHGAAVLFGYKYALEQEADYVFQTDSDGQTLPNEFHQFWERRREKDILIGFRKHREDGFSRVFITKTLKLILKLIFGLNITDANTPYRLMNSEVLRKYIGQVPKDYNLTNVLLTVLFLDNSENVEFIPITFRPRQGGVNSINMRRITKIGIQAVRDFHVIKKEMRK